MSPSEGGGMTSRVCVYVHERVSSDTRLVLKKWELICPSLVFLRMMPDSCLS